MLLENLESWWPRYRTINHYIFLSLSHIRAGLEVRNDLRRPDFVRFILSPSEYCRVLAKVKVRSNSTDVLCIAHWAKKPKKAFAIHLLTLLMTLSPSLCSLSFLTSSPSLSVTPSDNRVLSQPLALPIYLNKLSLDDSLHAISSNLGV